mmetsp:Transcript_31131/g.74616  ORF Transcript_31131/g.74616 Transcript_31131/m.74616 type:complete len:206 (+) Transcript_31131:859-1476(+)
MQLHDDNGQARLVQLYGRRDICCREDPRSVLPERHHHPHATSATAAPLHLPQRRLLVVWAAVHTERLAQHLHYARFRIHIFVRRQRQRPTDSLRPHVCIQAGLVVQPHPHPVGPIHVPQHMGGRQNCVGHPVLEPDREREPHAGGDQLGRDLHLPPHPQPRGDPDRGGRHRAPRVRDGRLRVSRHVRARRDGGVVQVPQRGGVRG